MNHYCHHYHYHLTLGLDTWLVPGPVHAGVRHPGLGHQLQPSRSRYGTEVLISAGTRYRGVDLCHADYRVSCYCSSWIPVLSRLGSGNRASIQAQAACWGPACTSVVEYQCASGGQVIVGWRHTFRSRWHFISMITLLLLFLRYLE